MVNVLSVNIAGRVWKAAQWREINYRVAEGVTPTLLHVNHFFDYLVKFENLRGDNILYNFIRETPVVRRLFRSTYFSKKLTKKNNKSQDETFTPRDPK